MGLDRRRRDVVEVRQPRPRQPPETHTDASHAASLGCGRECSNDEAVVLHAGGCFDVGVSPPDVDGFLRTLVDHGVTAASAVLNKPATE